MAMYRVRAEVSVAGGPWEPYDVTINSTRELDDMPPPDDVIRDIQHDVARRSGGKNTDVHVRNAIVSEPEEPTQ